MEIIPCSWIGRLNIIKMQVVPNLIRVNANPVKIIESYVVDMKKYLFIKCICKGKRLKTPRLT